MDRLTDAELHALLHEDVPYGDLTTHSLDIGARSGKCTFHARAAMRVCATEEAARLFQLAGASAKACVPSGADVAAGDVLLAAEGDAASLHTAWKMAQTLAEYASGIATAAAAMVTAVAGIGKSPPVACTRKNFPGTRRIAARAVRAGGALSHRLGLSESILVFAEHRTFCQTAPAQIIARLRNGAPEKRIVIEVSESEEGLAFAAAGADIIQLEKFSVEQTLAFVQALERIAPATKVAAAGGVNLRNAADYARTGVDLLVTSAPYFAPPADVKVRIEAAAA